MTMVTTAGAVGCFRFLSLKWAAEKPSRSGVSVIRPCAKLLVASAMVLSFLAHAQNSPGRLLVTAGGSSKLVYESSHALLIGTSSYSHASAWPNLPTIAGELAEVSKALSDQGFVVTRVQDPTGDQLLKEIKSFLTKSMGKNVRAIVYFSGHGWTDSRGVGYLVGADAPSANEPNFKTRLVSMELIRSLANESSAKHTLFVFDSCYSGAIFRAAGNEEIRPVVLEELQRDSVQFLSSGSATQRVPGRSVFAPTFVAGISTRIADADQDGIVQAVELAAYLRREVPRQSMQTPQFGPLKETGGQMIFAPAFTSVTGVQTESPGPTSKLPKNSPGTTSLKVEPVSVVNLPKERAKAPPGEFRTNFPAAEVFYYRKNRDALKILDALNKSSIPFIARPAELPESTETNAVACGPATNWKAVQAVTISMIDAGVPIRAIYTFAHPENKPGRVQLNTLVAAQSNPLLSKEDVNQLSSCPRLFKKKG